MSNYISYPRTDVPRRDASPPPGALANVTDAALREKLLKKMRPDREAFNRELPHLSFLIPSYLDPIEFKDVWREDNPGRAFHELGAEKGDLRDVSIVAPYLLKDASSDTKTRFALLEDYARNSFKGLVTPAQELGDDIMLYRFIGASYIVDEKVHDGTRYTCNPIAGRFWGIGDPPTEEKEWRAMCAIPGTWNGDGGYVSCRLGDLPESDKAIFKQGFYGEIGPQPSMVPGYYLPGGYRQLVVPTLNLTPAGEKFFAALTVNRSAWNQEPIRGTQ